MWLKRENNFFIWIEFFYPVDCGADFGGELEGAKGGFYALTLCHMFERDRTGCADGSDSYYHTDVATRKINIRQERGSYSMRFTARVNEYHFDSGPSRPGGAPLDTLTGRVGFVRGWVCETAAWEAGSRSCVVGASSELDVQHEDAQYLLEEAQRQLEQELDNAIARAEDQATETEIELQISEIERQIQEDSDESVRLVEAELARQLTEMQMAEIERQLQEDKDEAVRLAEAEFARQQAEIAQAEEERRMQQLVDDQLRRMEAEVARQQAEIARIQAEIAMETANMLAEIERDAAIARAVEALAEAKEEMNAARAEDEPEDP
jgi:hypothetical protein